MKVLVCGTNYGATYLRAIALQPQFGINELQLVGVMSRGSERSRNYANNFAVQHYTDIEEISHELVDIACVALLGDHAISLSQALMRKGIHVICEHPLSAAQLAECLTVAKQCQVHFFVNAHFADLQAPTLFVQHFRAAQQQSQCLHVTLTVNLRTLYSGLDIIGRAFGSLDDIQIRSTTSLTQKEAQKAASDNASENSSDSSQPPEYFSVLNLYKDNVLITLICQNFASEQDDGSATFMNHGVKATFVAGQLNLDESNGPVTWHPSPALAMSPQWATYQVLEQAPMNIHQLQQQRDAANLNTLRIMAHAVKTSTKAALDYSSNTLPVEQTEPYLRALTQLSDKVTEHLMARYH